MTLIKTTTLIFIKGMCRHGIGEGASRYQEGRRRGQDVRSEGL